MAERVCHRAIERLRGKSMKPNHRVLREHGPWGRCDVVLLADAEAAVRAAVDARTAEIVKLVEGYDAYSPTGIMVRNDIAAEVARRFPNGGTNDGK